MKLASLAAPNSILRVSLVAEGVTAIAVLVVPNMVAVLLFGAAVEGPVVVFARLVGIALIALVIACWPRAGVPVRRSLAAVVVYNALAAAYLAWLGLTLARIGILLWPAVAEHALVALLLAPGLRHGAAALRVP